MQPLNRTKAIWDRQTRNDININWDIIESNLGGSGEQSTEALSKANQALNKSENAVTVANDTKEQLNNIILESGNSEPEVVQARGTYPVLNERLDVFNENIQKADSNISNIQVDFTQYVANINDPVSITAGLKMAISDVSSRGGGKVYVPGFYYTTERLDMPSNVSLVGDGPLKSGILKHVSHIHSDIILIRTATSNVNVEGLLIDGKKTDGNLVTNKGVNLQGSNCKVLNCNFINIYQNDAVYNSGDNNVIDGCNMDGCDRHGVTSIKSKNLTISNNIIRNSGLYGIDLEPNDENTQSNEDFKIFGNIVNTTASHGIVATVKARNGIITNNTLTNITNEAIINSYDTSGVIVMNNVIDGCGDGITLRLGAKDNIIKGNIIKNAKRYGIRIGNSDTDVVTGVEVSGNTIINPNRLNATYDYIRSENATTKCKFFANKGYCTDTIFGNYAINMRGVNHSAYDNTFDNVNVDIGIYLSANTVYLAGNFINGVLNRPFHTNRFRIDTDGQIVAFNNGASFTYGTGTPEGTKAASVGSLYMDKSTTAKLYFKQSGTGNTGWKEVSLV